MGNSNLDRLLGISFSDKHMTRTARNLYLNESYHTLISIINKEIETCVNKLSDIEGDPTLQSLSNKLSTRLNNLEMLQVEVSYLLNSHPEEDKFQD